MFSALASSCLTLTDGVTSFVFTNLTLVGTVMYIPLIQHVFPHDHLPYICLRYRIHFMARICAWNLLD